MKHFLLILFFVANLNLSAQEWSEPINISNMEGSDENPDFTKDNDGVLHCVWSHDIETNFHKIYYSKSEDDGETWSEPQNISQNDEMWMGLPHIVSDSQNNLYVAYLYNAGNYMDSHIYFMKFDGLSWSEPYSISGNYLGVGMSDVVIDNNDRVYVFWHWGGPSGEIYYRYLENDEWSDIICPYENNNNQYCLVEGVCDSFNNLHCIIDHHPEDIGSRTSYIKYDYAANTWEDAIILASRTCWSGKDIALDSNEYPHLVWREYVNDSIPPNDGTLYSHFDGENFTEPEILVEDPYEQVIVIDENDYKHIVEREKTEEGWRLVYYFLQNGNLEGEIIDECETNFVGKPKIIYRNQMLYLVYLKYSPGSVNVYFSKKEIETNTIEESVIKDLSSIYLKQNYPNPFNPETQINYSLNKGGSTTLKILNIKGQLIKMLINDFKQKGEYSITWDGTDNNNKPVSSGVYYYRLQVDNRVKTKSLTLVK